MWATCFMPHYQYLISLRRVVLRAAHKLMLLAMTASDGGRVGGGLGELGKLVKGNRVTSSIGGRGHGNIISKCETNWKNVAAVDRTMQIL